MRTALLLTLGALALRLVIAIGLATDEPDDGKLYTRLAHNVVTAGMYSIDEHPPLAPTYIRVPGYPLFIAGVYRTFGDWNDTAVRAAQAVLDTATCWMVALLAAAWTRVARDEGASPSEEGDAVNEKRDAVDETRVVVDENHGVVNEYHVVVDENHGVVNEYHVVVDRNHVVVNKDHVVVDKDHVVVNKDHVVVDKDHVVVDEDHVVVDEDHVVVFNENDVVVNENRIVAGNDRAPALAAFVLAALCPFPLIYTAALLTETLALCLGVATVSLITVALWPRDRSCGRPGTWAAIGAGSGLSALVRPENGLYLAVAGAMLLLATVLDVTGSREGRASRRRIVASRALRGVALVAGFVAVVAPWTIRNALVFGRFEPLNPQSVSMPDEFVPRGYETWVRTWIDHPRYIEHVLFGLDTEAIHVADVAETAFDSPEERDRVEALFAQYDRPAPDAEPDAQGRLPPGGMTPAIDSGFGAIARERIARHPFRYYVVLPVRRALALWFNPHADYYPFAGYLVPLAELDTDRAQQVWLPVFLGLLVAWTIAGWAGAWTLWRRPSGRPVLVLVALLIVPRLALLAWLPNPEPRYTVEFFPIVSALAACWIAGAVYVGRRPSTPNTQRMQR